MPKSKEEFFKEYMKKKHPNMSDEQIDRAINSYKEKGTFETTVNAVYEMAKKSSNNSKGKSLLKNNLTPTELLGKDIDYPLILDTGIGKNDIRKPDFVFKNNLSEDNPSSDHETDIPSEYDKALDKATTAGIILESGKMAANLSRIARNEATTPSKDFTAKKTSLLDYKEINPDFSEINRDLGSSIGQMRAMGLGGAYINSLFRNGLLAKNKQIIAVNEANRQGRQAVAGANANIEAGNNSNQLKVDTLNAQRNLQLGASKAMADSKLYGSLFDNATNVYNYKIDNASKKMKEKEYEEYLKKQDALGKVNGYF